MADGTLAVVSDTVNPDTVNSATVNNAKNAMNRRTKPEVLAPAGNLRGLKTAVDFGAEQVGGAVFETVPLSLGLWAKILGVSCTVVILNEGVKAVRRSISR